MKTESTLPPLPWEEQMAHHLEKLSLIGSLELPHLHATRAESTSNVWSSLEGGGADKSDE